MVRAWLQKLLTPGSSASPQSFRPEVEALEVRYTPSHTHHAASHFHSRGLTIAEYNPYTGTVQSNSYTDNGVWTGWAPWQQYLIDGGYQRLGTYDPYTDTGSWNYYDASGSYAGSWNSFWSGSGYDDFWSSLGY